jgi:dihydroneopterin aldolase
MPKQKTAIIGVSNHVIQCILGDLPHEREYEQSIIVDIEVEADVSKAVVSDLVEDTINYVDLAQVCTNLAVFKKYKLIETFVHDSLDYFFSHWPIHWAKIRVRKPSAISTAHCAFVEMQRRRASGLRDG